MKNVSRNYYHRTLRFEVREVGTFNLICVAENPKNARREAEAANGYIMIIDNDSKYRTAMIINNGIVETISKNFADETK